MKCIVPFQWACSLLILAAAGCGGDGVERTELSGNVMFDGKPVPYGLIRFTPDKSKQHSGPQGYAEIVNGRYDTAQSGQGILPGPHHVHVTAYDEKPRRVEDETSPESLKSKPPLFADFPLEQELKNKTQDFSIPPNAKGYSPEKKTARRRGVIEP